MRKGHIKILEKSKQQKFPNVYMNYLMVSTAPIRNLESLYDFLSLRLRWKTGCLEDFEIFERVNATLNKYAGYSAIQYAAVLEKQIIWEILEETDSSEIQLKAMDIAASNTVTGKMAVELAEEINKESVLYSLLTYPYHQKIYNTDLRKSVQAYDVAEKIKLAELYKKFEESRKTFKEEFVKLAETYISNKKSPMTLENTLKNKNVIYEKIKDLSSYCIESNEDVRKIPAMVQCREKLEKIVEEYKITGTISLEIDIPVVLYSFSNTAVNIFFKRINHVSYNAGRNSLLFSYEKYYTNEYVIFFDSLEIYQKKKKKLFPTSLKNAQYSIRSYGECAENIFSMICDIHCEKGEYIWRDIKSVMLSEHVCYMPLRFRELRGMTGIKNLCETKYTKDIPINWNKGDLGINYLTYKSYLYIIMEDRNILMNECRHMSDISSASAFYEFVKSHDLTDVRCEILFPLYIIYKKLDRKSFWKDADGNIVSEHQVFISVKDYLLLLLKLKRKIHLRFLSAKKMKAAHDDAAVAYEEKTQGIPLIKIPKNSRFHPLRKKLPKSFEWIITKKRIILEGRNMHHCVAGYVEKINKDLCAIYSFIYPKTGKRYTVEFMQQKNGIYYMNQIQSMCDRGASDEVKQYVYAFLDSAS